MDYMGNLNEVNNMLPKVTVIMPIYNVGKYLEKSINSVLNQTYKNFELYLVDDGSTDNSPEIVDVFAKKDNRIIAVHQNNSGVDAARNVGIKQGTGKYMALIDSDDYYHETYLEKLVATAEESKSDLVVCGFEPFGVDNPPKVKILEAEEVDKIQAMKHLLGYNSFNGYVWNKLFRLDVVKENHLLFEDGYWACDDLLFSGNYIYHCNKVRIIEDKLYYYRQVGSGANRSRYSGKVKFDKKWMASFKVTAHFRDLFGEEVYSACNLHEVREAGIVLRSMAAGNYSGEEYKELKKLMKRNWWEFVKSQEVSYTQKLSVFLSALSPKLELTIWKKINKV